MRAKRNRAAIRIDHRRVRAGLSRFLDQLDTTGSGRWIVSFDPMPGEPDLGPLMAERTDWYWALTRTPEAGRDLTVHDAAGPTERHRYGYRQPTSDARQIADDVVCAVLVPGLAFDRHGGRLGFGAGYYDRFLERLGPEVLRIGVSDGFVLDRLPSEEHDVPMTHLATEIGVVPLPLG